MDMPFLVQMRQSNKCGNVGNDEIICTWDLVWTLESTFPASCKITATFIDSIHPNNQPSKNKESRNEIQLPANSIVLPWPKYTDPRVKRGELGTQP